MGSLEYAQARLSARYGRRPDEIAWRRIEHLRELPALVDAARASPVGAWLAGIGPMSPPHEIERVLREPLARAGRRGRRVDARRVAGRDPLVRGRRRSARRSQHLARGGAPLPWMEDDEVLRELCEREAAGFGAAPVGGTFSPLAPAWAEPLRLGSAVARRVAAPDAGGGRRRDEPDRRARARARPALRRLPRSGGRATAGRCAATLRGAAHAALPPRDARSRGGVHLPRARGARSRAAARRACPPRRVPAAAAVWPDSDDPAQARPLVRDPRRPRRRDAGARGAGDHRGRRARGAPVRGAARGARGPAPAALRVRRAVGALPRLLAAREGRAVGVPRAAGGDAGAQPRAPAGVGRGCGAGDPAAAALRGRARRAAAVAPRAAARSARASSTSRASPARARCCTRGCSCSRPTASRSCRRARSRAPSISTTRWCARCAR